MKAPTFEQVAAIVRPLCALNAAFCYAGAGFNFTAADFLARQTPFHHLVFMAWWVPPAFVTVILTGIMAAWSKRRLVAVLHGFRDDMLAQGNIRMARRVEQDIATLTRKRRRRK